MSYDKGYEDGIDALIRDILMVQDALHLACAKLAETLGTCPYDYEGYQPCDCESECDNDLAGCWFDYFNQKTTRKMLSKEAE